MSDLEFPIYARIDWENPPEGEPTRLLYECQSDGNVTRTVEIFADGNSSHDTLAIMKNREFSAFPLVSLVEKAFTDADEMIWLTTGRMQTGSDGSTLKWSLMVQSAFDDAFRKARPKTIEKAAP